MRNAASKLPGLARLVDRLLHDPVAVADLLARARPPDAAGGAPDRLAVPLAGP